MYGCLGATHPSHITVFKIHDTEKLFCAGCNIKYTNHINDAKVFRVYIYIYLVHRLIVLLLRCNPYTYTFTIYLYIIPNTL